jgi:hypothetical protein
LKIRATVICTYENMSVSQAIAASLSPDNLQATKSVGIKTVARGKQVVTNIDVEGRIETILATLDDLLSCTSTAESVL